jgi:hypothetical protein
LDPLIKSQLASLKNQRIRCKPTAFWGNANQMVTPELQTAKSGPLGLEVSHWATDSHVSCAIAPISIRAWRWAAVRGAGVVIINKHERRKVKGQDYRKKYAMAEDECNIQSTPFAEAAFTLERRAVAVELGIRGARRRRLGSMGYHEAEKGAQ